MASSGPDPLFFAWNSTQNTLHHLIDEQLIGKKQRGRRQDNALEKKALFSVYGWQSMALKTCLILEFVCGALVSTFDTIIENVYVKPVQRTSINDRRSLKQKYGCPDIRSPSHERSSSSEGDGCFCFTICEVDGPGNRVAAEGAEDIVKMSRELEQEF